MTGERAASLLALSCAAVGLVAVFKSNWHVAATIYIAAFLVQTGRLFVRELKATKEEK